MTDYLAGISSPADIKKLTEPQLEALSGQIRSFLIENVTKTGGHLASNLGVVEATVALLAVFEPPKDKIIWDVGHQSYVYKLLTGRRDGFKTLRKFGGMSGFPKTAESEYDCFNTGHSSTSASAAVGMARARDLLGEKNDVIAFFGDGALTGGMMYEAMNDAGRSKTKVIFVLNDNEMSISRNVGALSKYLRALRQKPMYFKSKEIVLDFLSKFPRGGVRMAHFLRGVKRAIRSSVLPTTIFDDLGFDYYGPIDGHNFRQLFAAFSHARDSSSSVFIHIITKKGKGYPAAEQNPQDFHGISAAGGVKTKDYSEVFGEKLCALAEENPRIAAITGAMPAGTGLLEFRRRFKRRYFDVGIAEGHAVTMAAGMAMAGLVPVVPLYSSFLQRAYDQTLHDVCLQNLHVVFPIDRAGVVGADGETHQGMYDISFLRAMPNMTILSPSSFSELEQMLDYAVNVHKGPIAIRYPRGSAQADIPAQPFELGKARVVREGTDAVIFTTGRMTDTALCAARECEKDRISVEVCVFATILPLDAEFVRERARGKRAALSIEDGVRAGGFGEALADIFALDGAPLPLVIKAFDEKPVPHGSISELDRLFGMDYLSVAGDLKEKINEQKGTP